MTTRRRGGFEKINVRRCRREREIRDDQKSILMNKAPDLHRAVVPKGKVLRNTRSTWWTYRVGVLYLS